MKYARCSLLLLWLIGCAHHDQAARRDTNAVVIPSITPQGALAPSQELTRALPSPTEFEYKVTYALAPTAEGAFFIEEVFTPHGPMIWLERPVTAAAGGRIVDHVQLDSLRASERLVEHCQYDSVTTRSDLPVDIFAIAAHPTEDSLGAIRLAWHVNRQTQSLVRVKTDGLHCALEGTDGTPGAVEHYTYHVLPADSTTSADTAYGIYAEDLPVTVLIGRARISFDSDSTFRDSIRMLPKPALLPPEDPTDHMHGNDQYCYAFTGGFLVFEEADDGIWKASLMRRAPSKTTHCPMIDVTPTIRVGDQTLSIDMPPAAINETAFPGFRAAKSSKHRLEYKWWHVTKVSDGRTSCAIASIDLTFTVRDTVLNTASVAEGAEGWGARQVERSEGAGDSVWTCRLRD